MDSWADAANRDDEFVILNCKVLDCPKRSKHDWTECPYAHPGEKARRRDLRFFRYQSKLCPELDATGACTKGDSCPYSHNLFESYLHPERFRTVLCSSGNVCSRKLCFFAHSVEQLRQPTSTIAHFKGADVRNLAAAAAAAAATPTAATPAAAAAAGGSSPTRIDGMRPAGVRHHMKRGVLTAAIADKQQMRLQDIAAKGTNSSNSSRSATPPAAAAAAAAVGTAAVGVCSPGRLVQQQQQQHDLSMLEMLSDLMEEVKISKQEAAGAAARAAAANAQAAAIKAELDAMKAAAAAAAANGGSSGAAAAAVIASGPGYQTITDPSGLIFGSDQQQWSDLMMIKQQQQQQQQSLLVNAICQSGPMLAAQQTGAFVSDGVVTHVPSMHSNNAAAAAAAPLQLVPVFKQQPLNATLLQQQQQRQQQLAAAPVLLQDGMHIQQQQQQQMPMQAVMVQAPPPAASAAAMHSGVSILSAPSMHSGQAAVLSRPMIPVGLTPTDAAHPMYSSSNCLMPGMFNADPLHTSMLSAMSSNNNVTDHMPNNMTVSGGVWPADLAALSGSSLLMNAPLMAVNSSGLTTYSGATLSPAAAAAAASGGGFIGSSGSGLVLVSEAPTNAGFWSHLQTQNGTMM